MLASVYIRWLLRIGPPFTFVVGRLFEERMGQVRGRTSVQQTPRTLQPPKSWATSSSA